MFKFNEVDELFRCLLSGIKSPPETRRSGPEQCRQALSAFNRIEDQTVRQELMLLMELASLMPGMSQTRTDGWAMPSLTTVH
jgi:hypothetical protein